MQGVMTLVYQLPTFPSEGKWTIRVEAMSQVHDHHIIVERFYYRFFDVITFSAFICLTSESLLRFFFPRRTATSATANLVNAFSGYC